MKLEQLCINSLNDIYVVTMLKKEFKKAVDEAWKDNPPWQRYQNRLILDLAILEQEKEKAVDLPYFEKITGVDDLYSIRHPESRKNVRVIYTILSTGEVILLTAFLEKNDNDYSLAIDRAQKRMDILCKD